MSTMQNHYNLVYREEEREMIPLCRDQGVGLIPWSPLARGFFTGNRPKGAEPATVRGRSDTIAPGIFPISHSPGARVAGARRAAPPRPAQR